MIDERLVDLDPAVVAQDLRARLPLDVLHHDEVLAAALVAAGVEHLHDVRVHEARRRLRLALEARDERRVVGEVLGEQLDRDLALQAQVEREVHGRHAAEAEPALEPVAPGDLRGAHLAASWPPRRCRRRRRRSAAFALRRAGFAALLRRAPACRRPGRVGFGVFVVVGGVVVVVVVVGFGVVVGRAGRARRAFSACVVVVGRLRERLRAQRRSARLRRFSMPWRSVLRRPASIARAAARRSPVRSSAAPLRSPCSCRRRSSAACATASKSLCSGPALAAGIRPLPELPHATSSAASTPSAAASATRSERALRAPAARTAIGRRGACMLTDRTPGARRASPAAARRGSRRRRRRCRSRRA